MAEPTPAEVGARIAAARHVRGISQARLAAEVGTSRRNIIRWEHGHNAPRSSALRKIAATLDVSVDDLVGNR